MIVALLQHRIFDPIFNICASYSAAITYHDKNGRVIIGTPIAYKEAQVFRSQNDAVRNREPQQADGRRDLHFLRQQTT